MQRWARRCLALALLFALPFVSTDGQAERRDERPVIKGKGDSGELGKELEGVFDDVFGSEQSEPVLSSYEPTGYDYSQIEAERPRSLGIFRSTAYGLVGEPALNAYVNRVLQRVAEHAPEGPIPTQAYVVADPAFGAAAAPDGALFLNFGLLRDLENEDELAFILAHELSHVILRHHGSDWYVSAQRKALVGMELAKDLVAKVQQMAGTAGAESTELQTAIIAGSILYQFSDIAVAPFFTREEEDEADILGLDLMIAAGYNMGAATSLLEKMDAWEVQQAEKTPPKTEAEHEQEMQDAFAAKGLAGAIEAAFSAFSDTFEEVKKELKTEHYPAAERIGTVQNYMLRFYLKDVPPPTTDLAWNGKEKDARTIQALFANYDAAKAARSALAKGDTKRAESEARKAVGEITKHDAFTRLAFYTVRKSQGKNQLARRNLELARESPEPSLMLYKTLIDDAIERREWKEAVSLVETARRELADSPFLLPYRIELYPRVGRKDETPRLMIECNAEYPELAESCQTAANES